jgi:plasmid replication initiation protein
MSDFIDTDKPRNLGQISRRDDSQAAAEILNDRTLVKSELAVNSAGELANLGKNVRQSNDFARNRLNIHDIMTVRMLACLASTVREDDSDFRELTVSAKTVLGHTGGSDYKALKAACDKLLNCILERKLNDRGGFQKYTLFSTIGYENGMIFAKFHPDLKPFFLGLKSHFMKYDLREFLTLPSIYSQKLFEYLKSWDNCVERTEDIETIYLILGVPEYARNNFKEFRTHVLEKAHQDISKLTSLRYEWEAVRKGSGKTSPVTAIRFIFSLNGQDEIQKARKEASDKKIRDERNRLYLEALKCSTAIPDCAAPKKTGRCAVCFKSRGLELPGFLLGRLPDY